MKNSLFVMILCVLLSSSAIHAQYENTLKVRPVGRILFDGALNVPDSPLYQECGDDGAVFFAGPRLSDGVALPDVRLGAKASYGHWSAKIDVGYAFRKISFKDVFIQYDFDSSNYIRGGYFVAPYGLNAAVSSSMIPTMESASSDDFFQVSNRNVGVMYLHYKDSFYAAATALVESDAMFRRAGDNGKLSAAGVVRLVYSPAHSFGKIFHVGLSGWVQSSYHNLEENGTLSTGYFDFTANFPTRVNDVCMMDANVTDARSVWKLSPEILAAYGPLALETQFYTMNVSRCRNLDSYSATGFYANLRALVLGKGYGYANEDAGLSTPSPGSLELVAGYNYTDGSDRKAAVFGGRSNDFSLTCTYYFNKYMLARLRYSYTKVSGSEALKLYPCHANIIQARIQFLF